MSNAHVLEQGTLGIRTLARLTPTRKAYERSRSELRTYRWRKTRKQLIKVHPYCAVCGAHRDDGAKLEVDHIIRPVDGGSEYDLSNLEVKCTFCHHRKTARDAKIRRKHEAHS